MEEHLKNVSHVAHKKNDPLWAKDFLYPQNQPYTEVCPQCKGPIKVLYKHGVWSCSNCKIKITQTVEGGITNIDPMLKFGIDPLERAK